eukprot:COSAG02_NODE_12144_length_1590_cov_1.363514_1_plen_124_part_00
MLSWLTFGEAFSTGGTVCPSSYKKESGRCPVVEWEEQGGFGWGWSYMYELVPKKRAAHDTASRGRFRRWRELRVTTSASSGTSSHSAFRDVQLMRLREKRPLVSQTEDAERRSSVSSRTSWNH